MQANEPERMRAPVRNRRMIMKTKEELNALKNEFDANNQKYSELTESELMQVTGGESSYDKVTQCLTCECGRILDMSYSMRSSHEIRECTCGRQYYWERHKKEWVLWIPEEHNKLPGTEVEYDDTDYVVKQKDWP